MSLLKAFMGELKSKLTNRFPRALQQVASVRTAQNPGLKLIILPASMDL